VSEEKGKARLDVVELKNETKITPDEIRQHLEKIKTSGLTFIRNGQSWPDSSMADLLESKYTINREDIKTKEDFVQKVVQTSSSTGETYRVIAGNDTLTLVNWLGL
jgi:regulatory protein YycI of two-component signal transduction system YycFG